MDEVIESAGATEPGSTDTGYDVERASDNLAGDLFPSSGADQSAADDTPEPSETSEPSDPEPEPTPVTARSAPKAWAADKHEVYSKLPPEAQDYIDQREKQMMDGLSQYRENNDFGKQMRDAVAPYQDLIQEAGVDAPRAVQALLNAHKLLTRSTPDQKHTYFLQLARDYGIDVSGQAPAAIDPAVKELRDRLDRTEQALNQRQTAELEERRAKTMAEVNEFAADKAHAYFEDVADDMITLLKTGLDLPAAYEKAVWANPITRQKEIERINAEADSARTKKAQEEAAAAKAATATNIRNRDTRRTPTEPRATMRNLDDALRDSMREINSRH
jgi:post-segregation antitoxin (ccd killing protein)